MSRDVALPAVVGVLVASLLLVGCSRPGAVAPGSDRRPGPADRVLALHERDARFNGWLKARFETILPEIMRREHIDMWIVICREHNEDPVYTTLVRHPSMFAWRLTMFVYFDRGASSPIERLTVNRYGGGDLHKEFPAYYQAAWEPETIDSWQRLAQIVRARNPKVIAVNTSDTWAFADGLSVANRARLVQALGPELARRIVSAERLVVGWLERRSQAEIDFYSHPIGYHGHAGRRAGHGRLPAVRRHLLGDRVVGRRAGSGVGQPAGHDGAGAGRGLHGEGHGVPGRETDCGEDSEVGSAG